MDLNDKKIRYLAAIIAFFVMFIVGFLVTQNTESLRNGDSPNCPTLEEYKSRNGGVTLDDLSELVYMGEMQMHGTSVCGQQSVYLNEPWKSCGKMTIYFDAVGTDEEKFNSLKCEPENYTQFCQDTCAGMLNGMKDAMVAAGYVNNVSKN